MSVSTSKRFGFVAVMNTVFEKPQNAFRSATLGDIAREAGVSLNTASRVLNGQVKGAYPKAQMRFQRIERIAAELGYRANTAARATACGKFNAVGFLFRDDGTAVGSHLVYGVNQVLLERKLRLILSPLHRREELNQSPAILREMSVDGLLISLMQDVPDDFRLIADSAHTPAVWINAKLDLNCVRPDDQGMARQLTEQLLARGHRRIAYLRYDHLTGKHYSSRDRHAGYCDTMLEAGLTPHDISAARHDDRAREAAIEGLLRCDPRPTAVVCGNDSLAYPLLYAAARFGIGVPADLSVVAVRDSERDPLGAGLSGVMVPFQKVGEAAARMLQRRIETDESQATEIIETTFSAGRTVETYRG